jgi:RNA polymerase sigma factor (sigma-70 family)
MQRPRISGPTATTLGANDTKLLVRAAARGDQEAWNRLVDRYSALLWAIARSHRLDGAEAADVVQGSWLRLVENLETIRTPEGVGSWLATTARRECLRTIRRTARVQPSDQMESLSPVEPSEIDGGLLDAERNASLWQAFQRLPRRDQQLLRLLTADPAPSYDEIGAALGMPIGSIGPTRARALGRLRRELERAGTLGAVRTSL